MCARSTVLGGDDEGENTATEETTTQEATEPTTDAQETSAAAAPTSAAAPTAAANGGIPEYSSLVERVPEAQGALPAPFLATVERGCTVTEPISSFIEGLGEEVIQCNGPSGEAAEGTPDNGMSRGFRFVSTGDQVQTVQDFLSNNAGYNVETIQEAGDGNPEIRTYTPADGNGGTGYSVYYPDQQILIYGAGYMGDPENAVDDTLRYWGFLA